MKKSLTLILAAILIASLLVSCGGGGLPNGRYEPAAGELSSFDAIVINGSNITMTYAFGAISQTYKYSYKNGTLTYTEGGASLNVACTYDKDTKILEWAGIKYEKVK
ncbi:MAG: hypothetical protein LBC41_01580 [Clostridiales bacterium]|jgi:hypothetical protein|nr:hypothetical protein [Clostridiales bacterium]MDR2749325.1 hypothetical protein [Clostridiales bacterium]